jgi:hypothetical protein
LILAAAPPWAFNFLLHPREPSIDPIPCLVFSLLDQITLLTIHSLLASITPMLLPRLLALGLGLAVAAATITTKVR